MDSTPVDWTHVTYHEGSIVASPSGVSNEIQDGTLDSHPKNGYNSQPAILKNNTDYTDLFKDELSKDIGATSEPVPVKNAQYINEIEDTIDRGQKDDSVWTKFECIKDRNQDGISFSVSHRYGDMTTPSYRHISSATCTMNCVVIEEEEIRPMEMVMLKVEISVSMIQTLTNLHLIQYCPTNTSCPISMEETFLQEIRMIILEDLMVHTIQHFKMDQR